MKSIATLLAVLFLGYSATSLASEEDYAYKLMMLSDVKFSAMGNTEKRYRFVMPRLAEKCSDAETGESAANMVYVAYTKLDEAGLGVSENLVTLTENIYQLTSQSYAKAKQADIPFKCSEVWALYLSARLEGMQPKAAMKGIISIFTLLGR